MIDDERLRAARANREAIRDRFAGADSSEGYERPPNRSARRRRSGANGAEDPTENEMRLAIEASKVQAEEDQRKLQDADDQDLERALQLK